MTKRFFWSFIPFEVASVLMCLTMFTLLVSGVSGDEAAYEYDKLGRLIKVIYEDGPQFYYYYDKAGNRIEKQVTAPKSCGDVVVTNYTFTQDWTCGGSGQGLVIGGIWYEGVRNRYYRRKPPHRRRVHTTGGTSTCCYA